MENKLTYFLFLLLISGCALIRTENQETMFFVDKADSILPACDETDRREAALACHRLVEGGAVVVGIRRYSNPGLDRENFRKTTFVVDTDVAVGEVIDISSGRVRAAYGTGLSFMPGKSGCYGQAISGTVSILRNNDEFLELEATIEFDLKSPLGWTDACKNREFHARVVANRLTIKDLGPWEGVKAANDSPVAESVPN